eukprot:19178-Heterococcus_DN1.PRE.4
MRSPKDSTQRFSGATAFVTLSLTCVQQCAAGCSACINAYVARAAVVATVPANKQVAAASKPSVYMPCLQR